MVFYGCQTGALTNPVSPVYPVNVHMQGGFKVDSVLIIIDGQIILNGFFTTDPIVLICGSEKIDLQPGNHTLIARLPRDNVETQITFINDENELWIGVNNNSTSKEFNFIFQNIPFVYDRWTPIVATIEGTVNYTYGGGTEEMQYPFGFILIDYLWITSPPDSSYERIRIYLMNKVDSSYIDKQVRVVGIAEKVIIYGEFPGFKGVILNMTVDTVEVLN